LDKDPNIVSKKAVAAIGQAVMPQVNKAPFNNINVRRALMIGTDIKAFNNILGANIDMPIDFWPAYPGDPSVYTPISELPPNLQELYKYDPVKAKKMLADAGYPNGFRMEVVVEHTPLAQDRGSLLASQWSKIGVQVDVNVQDVTGHSGFRYDKNFKDAIINVIETPGAVFTLQRTGYTDATLNPGHYSNPKLDAQIDKIVATRDVAEMNRLTKAACVDLLADVPAIPLQVGLDGYYWWPWIQNYAGEFNVGDANQPVPLFACMWIDQALKKKLGH
jgi:peptide/nickel transport system substrate-binding protein